MARFSGETGSEAACRGHDVDIFFVVRGCLAKRTAQRMSVRVSLGSDGHTEGYSFKVCCFDNFPVLHFFVGAMHSSLLKEAQKSKHKHDLLRILIAHNCGQYVGIEVECMVGVVKEVCRSVMHIFHALKLSPQCNFLRNVGPHVPFVDETG